MKAVIYFAGKDQVVVSYNEFEQILKSANLNWYGVKHWSSLDLELFEELFDGLTVEPIENGMKIWNRNFDYKD